MRFVAVLFLLVMIPVLAYWFRTHVRDRKWAYFAIGILPFTMNFLNLNAALISWSTWPGYSKGMIITGLDSLAIAILITVHGSLRRLPFLGLFLAYLAAATFSITQSESPMSTFFYAFQVARMTLVFAAVATIVTLPDGLRWLCFGLAGGAIFQAVMTINERVGGALQASGTMGHQNLLGMMLHVVTIPLLALLFAGERNKIVHLGVLSGLIAVGLGASRGSIGFVIFGIAILLVGTVARGISVLALAIAGPIMATNLDRRLEVKPTETRDYDERAAFENAARMMWTDHPLGVGANQYVVQVNSQGYNNEAGITWAWASRSTNVHNLYLLAGSETGYFGFVTLIALFLWPIARGLQYAFRNRKDLRGEIVFGFTVPLISIGFHSLYEWIFVLEPMQYLFVISLAVSAGMLRQDRFVAMKKASRLRGMGVNGIAGNPISSLKLRGVR